MKTVPSQYELRKIMDCIKSIVFPDFSEVSIELNLAELKYLLLSQIVAVYDSDNTSKAEETVSAFVESLPEIGRLVKTDVEAISQNDPAISDLGEVILCYPLVTVMLHYRTAHKLYELGLPRIPRMLTEMAHSETGVDIHPAAKIGEYFAFDHGTGIVIGQTCIIGNHVLLYQGVTLGAKNFHYSDEGLPLNIPRHPILEDNVTVYSNTSILGRVTIGHDSVIGGNVWLTHDVPPCSKIIQGKSIDE